MPEVAENVSTFDTLVQVIPVPRVKFPVRLIVAIAELVPVNPAKLKLFAIVPFPVTETVSLPADTFILLYVNVLPRPIDRVPVLPEYVKFIVEVPKFRVMFVDVLVDQMVVPLPMTFTVLAPRVRVLTFELELTYMSTVHVFPFVSKLPAV